MSKFTKIFDKEITPILLLISIICIIAIDAKGRFPCPITSRVTLCIILVSIIAIWISLQITVDDIDTNNKSLHRSNNKK